MFMGAARFKFITNQSSYQDPSMLTDAKHTSLETVSRFDGTTILGENIEKDTKEHAQVLIITHEDNHDLKVVSIVGMGVWERPHLPIRFSKRQPSKNS
jgi:hypothetical protein